MSLIDQQKDLENFSDQALLQEATQPQFGYPPYLVTAEIQRRQQDRARVQQQTMATQPEAPPVVQQQVSEFASQMAPMAQPEPVMGGMPPEAGMGMAAPMMASAAPAEPVGIMGAAPVQAMAGGGEVKRMQVGGRPVASYDPLGRVVGEGMSAAGRGIVGAGELISGSSMLAPGSVASLRGKAAAEADRLRRRIALNRTLGLDTSQQEAALRALEGGDQPASTAAPTSLFNVRPGTDFGGEVSAPTTDIDTSTLDSGISSIPISRRGDFMSTYRDVLGRIAPLEEVGIQSRKDILEGRVTPQGRVALDPFYVEEAKRLEQFRPSREKFERGSQAEILAGLGAIIGGATQRGDIAKGLAALTRQQREAERDFRREEREFAGFESGLRREERTEAMMRDQARAAVAREERQMSRQDISDALAMTQAIETSRYQADKLAAEVQNLNLQLQIAKQEAVSKGMSRQLELIIKTLEAKLTQAKTAEATERARALGIENSMNAKLASGGGGSYTRPEGLFTPTQ